ncbi:MAG: branched-chain amino acid transaminase [Candidatus Gracilibacteria bacterium]|jgi:branched-chain amino acid aminotransferase
MEQFAYIRRKFCKSQDAVVPIQCKAVQYGLGCFSGIRGNYNKSTKKLYLFRLDEHHNRLKEATKILGFKFDMPKKEFIETVTQLVKKNGAKEDIYIRPIVYAGSTNVVPCLDDPQEDLAIYMLPLGNYLSDKGLNVCISSWRRFDDDMISAKAKATGGYINSALAKKEAKENGYDEAIFLNRDGKVCEASGANIFGIKNGEIFTPHLSFNNLNGITRRSVIEIIENELGQKVREESFDRSTLYMFDELFLTGTAARISWIASVDKKQIGNGKEGPITKKLKKLYEEISLGENKKYMHWLTKI